MMRLFILLIAIGAGGAAAWVTTTATPTPVVVTTTERAPLPEVLVTAAPIEPGAVLARDHMRWQPWPEEALVEGYIRRAGEAEVPEDMIGLFARVDLVAGEPVRTEKFSRTPGGLLSVMLEPGMRAVAVRVSAESTAGGFIMPNDHVDVLRTVNRPGASGQSEIASQVILRNIRVLAIDQSTDTSDSGSVVGKTATLELTVDEVETVIAAEASGLLSLSLRSVAENSDDPRLVDAPSPKTTIRILRGGVMEEVFTQ